MSFELALLEFFIYCFILTLTSLFMKLRFDPGKKIANTRPDRVCVAVTTSPCHQSEQ